MFLIIRGIERVLGRISMETLIDDKGFRCHIKKPRKIDLSTCLIYYEIIERVSMEGGETSYTNQEVVHTSKKQRLLDLEENKNIKFYFPKKSGLHPVRHADVSRVWRMKLEDVNYLGFSLSYECELKVEWR